MRIASLMILVVSPAMAQATGAADHAPTSVPITPADRLAGLDSFRNGLSHNDRQRLDKALPRSADGGIARCDRTEGSRASCEAAAYMQALRSAGLMPRLLTTIREKRP